MAEADRIIVGDCLKVLADWPENCIDAVVTDPPYGWRFMGKKWDYDVPSVETWAEVLRVLKPGGHLLSFCGTRTYHRMTVNIEDAGFEVRDCLCWLYGSGFPKSLNVSKAIDKAAGKERLIIGIRRGTHAVNKSGLGGAAVGIPQMAVDVPMSVPATPEAAQWEGWGTALKPSCELICMARKPLSEKNVAGNVLKWGTGGINVDGGRIGGASVGWRGSGVSGGVWNESNSGLGKDGLPRPVKGRWPANTLFEDSHIPIWRLIDSGESGRLQAIREFYHDYKMPDMLQRVCDISEQEREEQGAVLQPGVLCQTSKPDGAGGQSSDVRKEAYTGSPSEDARDTIRTRKTWEGQSSLQGILDESGVSVHKSGCIGGNPTGNGPTDACQRTCRDSRTSAHGSNDAGQTTEAVRSGPSQERDQRRQSGSEPGTSGQLDTQTGTQGNPSGASSLTSRKSEVEVLACDIPKGWLKYFEPTGTAIRDPQSAAAMLDEQSGIQQGRGYYVQPRVTTYKPSSYKLPDHVPYHVGDSGGASRFFYVAKSSRSERTAKGKIDNRHPTVKPIRLMRYLCRLVTPPGGIVLDPFCGSGSTCIAAIRERFHYVGIEQEVEIAEIARKRLIGMGKGKE